MSFSRPSIRQSMSSSSLKIKQAIVRFVCSTPFAKSITLWYRGLIPFRGLTIDTTNQNVPLSGVPRLFWKFYERAEVDFVNAHLRPELPVIELGSCLGVVACCIARKKNTSTKQISVEANPHLRKVIIGNLKRNGLAENTTVVTGAIDYSGAEVTRLVVSEDAVGTHVERGGEHGTAEVPCLQLSRLLDEFDIRDDFALVCDVESAEADIILADEPGLRRCRQIVMEFHPGKYGPWNSNLKALLDKLADYGFVIVDRRGEVICFEKSDQTPSSPESGSTHS